MANQEALIAEYSTLRQEILQRIQMTLQFTAAGLPVASAFIVYGFQAHNSIAFLAAILTLVAALYYSSHGTNEIVKLGTYIHALIEPKVEGLQWETMVLERRKRENLFSPGISYPITICIFALFGIGCTFFTWWFLSDYRIFNVILYSCITVILAICFIVVSVYALHVSSTNYRADFVAQWKRLEEELYSKVASTKM